MYFSTDSSFLKGAALIQVFNARISIYSYFAIICYYKSAILKFLDFLSKLKYMHIHVLTIEACLQPLAVFYDYKSPSDVTAS